MAFQFLRKIMEMNMLNEREKFLEYFFQLGILHPLIKQSADLAQSLLLRAAM